MEMRKRGQVARSADLASMLVFVVVAWGLFARGGMISEHLRNFLTTSLAAVGTADASPQAVSTAVGRAWSAALLALGPVVLLAMVMGVVANAAQTGLLLSTQSLVPDLNRLNPLTGLQRLFSSRGAVETLKSLVKLTIVTLVAYQAVQTNAPQLLQLGRMELSTALGLLGETLFRVVIRIALLLLVLAALDYAYQRYTFEKQNRMTKYEVKQEHKQSETSPEVRSKIRSRMRAMSRKKMMKDVPQADVVVTNPTHFSVALKYDQAVGGAPKVVAKGADWLAFKIREIARENSVPIVENAPLARALYKQVHVGSPIPAEWYAAVAEVLAYVYSLKQKRTGR
jgi:flagellar biosynthetic protein FlhB